eukprot:gene9080-17028_t
MRTPNDRRLAMECGPGVLDLVLGGHDHDAENLIVGGVRVLKSGSDFHEFSEVTVSLPAARFEDGAAAWRRGGGGGALAAACAAELVKVSKERHPPDAAMVAVLRSVTDSIAEGLSRI